jgi:hypothetical protein
MHSLRHQVPPAKATATSIQTIMVIDMVFSLGFGSLFFPTLSSSLEEIAI